MKFLQDCWVALLELFNIATFSTTGGSSLQHSFQLPVHSSDSVEFTPPSGSENRQSTFKCVYPGIAPQWTNCSSPADRTCWLKGPGNAKYNISTDYETKWPTGIKRTYTLVVDEDPHLDTDGVVAPDSKVFNGIYPGPWIQACWGDDLEIKVQNKLQYNGTTIHWHGIRQLGTPEHDGVNAVTQCAIAPGQEFTYKFKATQYGSTWYHSHYSGQYGDGLLGPLTIHGPSAANYDDVRDPLLMTDWNHRSAFKGFHDELTATATSIPVVDSILLNGRGSYAGAGNCGQKYNTTFVKGHKYLLRLINTSTDTTFVFTIDNHNITVMSSDFVPIHPYTTDHVVIGIGQRYHVVVTASPKETSGKDSTASAFWIRTIPATGCSGGFVNGGTPDERQGIIWYGGSNRIPTTVRNNYSNYTLACRDEPYEKLVPIVPWTVGDAVNVHQGPNTGPNGDYFGVGLQISDPGNGRPLPSDTFLHWAIGDRPLWLNFSNPTILNLDNKTFNPDYVVIPEDYADGWIWLIIEADPLPKTQKRVDAPVAHPIHLHGHDFALLQQSTTNTTVNPIKPKKDNPPRRDVVLLPAGGYVVIAFRADNPGVWLLHCHIANHASSGLAMQILERQEAAQKLLAPRLKGIRDECVKWDQWFSVPGNRYPEPPFQEDSGI